MADAFTYLLAAIAGALGAALYFGGLWLTVRKLPASSQPHFLLALSFVARAAVLLLLFFAVASLGLLALLIAVIVFIVGRVLLTRRLATGTDR